MEMARGKRRMIKHFLFDLDGTLLPLDEKEFLNIYMSSIGEKFASLGMDPKVMVQRLWQGTNAMIQNNGKDTNEAVFWQVFYQDQSKQDAFKTELTTFYLNDFIKVKESTNPSLYTKKIVEHLKKLQKHLYLLTNPIFPKVATDQRIDWAGLNPEDFSHITTYENSYYAKPNIKYYQYILEAFNLDPSETMMVGNDAEEDMIAKELGMEVYLITDCLKNEKNLDISSYRSGSLKDFYDFVLELD